MKAVNLSQKTFKRISKLLQCNAYYQKLIKDNKEDSVQVSPQEILESCAYVLSLNSPVNPLPNPLENPKYLHTLAILRAVVVGKPEAEVQRLINLSLYNKQDLFLLAMKIFVYGKRWINLVQAQTFLGRPLNQSELHALAYAAGAAGNEQFLVGLRNLDSKLLNHAYEGEMEFGEIELVEKLGLEFVDYRAICNQPVTIAPWSPTGQFSFSVSSIMLFVLIIHCLSLVQKF